MLVTSVASARAIWLLDTLDLNPRGKYLFDQLFPWLAERYQFATTPAHARDQVDNAWEFREGKFTNPKNVAIIVTLKVYNDGLVSETRSSTEDSEAFLVDATTAAVRELGLTFTASMVHRKMYVSELNLACEKQLEDLHSRMRDFSNALSQAMGTRLEPTSLGFGSDPASQPSFRFERRANIPFSQNYYWSLASLPTTAHLTLLDQLEGLLTT